jgi:ElaB/YqjD/DUF883 family membrane-anchored ribosome-binding protein
MKQPP